MGDSTSAEIFGKQFKRLAKRPITEEKRKLAAALWNDMREFDFSMDEMYCDKALIDLGLAKKVKGEDGYPAIWYKGCYKP